MRAIRSRLVAALLAVAASAGGPAAVADDSRPEKILEGRGLKRSGTYYVVDAEPDFVARVAELRPSFQDLKAAHDKLAAVLQNQAEYETLDDQWTLVNEQLRKVQADIEAHPPLNNNFLRQQWYELLDAERTLRHRYSELQTQVNLRYRRLVADSVKERLENEFRMKHPQFVEKSKDLREQADTIQAEYRSLAKDEAVKKALDALKLTAKGRIVLGPSPSFKKESAWLAGALKITAPDVARNKGRKRPAAEKGASGPTGKGATKGKRAKAAPPPDEPDARTE